MQFTTEHESKVYTRPTPVLPVFLLAVMTGLPCCACGSPSFLTGFPKRAHCADIESLPLRSLKLPCIIGNNKACFAALNPPVATTIIQTLPFIISQLWQKAPGFSDLLFSHSGQSSAVTELQEKNSPAPAKIFRPAGESGVQPWLAGLYTESVLQKRRLLGILRQRVRQAIASGNYELAKILQNRIMVIGVDLSGLKNAEPQVSGNPTFQSLLLKGLLENSGEVRTYATRSLAVEAPVDQKESTSGGGSAGSQNEPSEKKPLSGSDSKPGSSHHGSGSSGDDPEPEQLQHTYSKEFCPVCKEEICKETEPGPAKDLNSVSQGHILALPPEILLYIFEHTSLSDRIALMQCCRRFAEIAANEKQILDWFHEYIPDILLPMGEAMSAALEAKTGGVLNHVSAVAWQALARGLQLMPCFCTHTLGLAEHEKWLGHIDCAAFADNRIVASNLDRMVRVWCIKEDGKGVCTHTLRGHTDEVMSVATLSDCWVISGSAFGTIKVWNINRPDGSYCTDTFKAAQISISFIETLPDRWIYSASLDKKVRVYFLTKEGRVRHQHLLSVVDGISCLRVLPDGQLFAGTDYGYIYLWKTTKHNETPFAETWLAHNNQVKCIEMLPNGQLLTCSLEYEIKIWDIKQPQSLLPVYSHNIPPATTCLQFARMSPEGQMIISSPSPYMQIVTFKNGEVDSVFTQKRGDGLIVSAAFLYDGRMITGCVPGKIKIWDYSDTRHPKQP